MPEFDDLRDEVLRANKRNVEKEPTPEPEPASFWKKAFSFVVLSLILTGFWIAGQFSIGVPDELVLQFLTILLYNWFVDNGYKLPDWLPNLFKK